MRPLARLVLVSLVVAGLPAAATAAPAAAPSRAPILATAPVVPLPDTGLFAPVARQHRARLERLASLAAGPASAERVLLSIATGDPDGAAKLAATLPASDPLAPIARGRAALARQDFKSLAATLAAMPAARQTEGARALRYQWSFARDDARGVDSSATAHVAREGDARSAPDLLALGRVAYDQLAYPRAESLFTRALAALPTSADRPAWSDATSARRASAYAGLALVQQKRREWDASLATLKQALAEDANAEVLMALTETLIRLGRTDEAISAAEWAVRIAPYHDSAHYLLGNGYARKNYTQLVAAYPRAFADAEGRAVLARADSLLGLGRRATARAGYGAVVFAHPAWADARVRLASLDFEDGRFDEARDGCFAALRTCPEYGRAHAVLAKALESQRFAVDVHRAGYEARFAAAPLPRLPGIEKFVANWNALSPRHQKRVALSVAPWKAFLPVLVEGGATYYIKPLWMQLSECPNLNTLRDQRINYDSRLWDDVRGCGGYHTVTGIEDVERTIFDRYNTVLHELTHQVHAVLPADDSRAIQELYRQAKERDDATRDGYLSRYAGGSVYEYFAEGANALYSPRRDAYDPREVVLDRLDRIDPALRREVEALVARTDVSASYPIAWAAGGDDRVERGRVDLATALYEKALERDPKNETALTSYSRALVLGGRAAEAEKVAARAVQEHPTSGGVRVQLSEAAWHSGRGVNAAREALAKSRGDVRAEDRYLVDAQLSDLAWVAGDATAALAAADSVLAYQSDSPEGQQARAAALALAGRWNDAFAQYDEAVRMRTGVVDLRNAYARDLLRAGRVAEARVQLDAAKLLDEENATAEALRAWVDLAENHFDPARLRALQAMKWGPQCDLARIVSAAAEHAFKRDVAAKTVLQPLQDRVDRNAPPEWIYRPKLATWEQVHALPAVEKSILEQLMR